LVGGEMVSRVVHGVDLVGAQADPPRRQEQVVATRGGVFVCAPGAKAR
jgi:hypothetical protein